ncbi:putative caffeoyl-CoA O-methyltransferase isoform X3 [Cinnamomum micranthum f. kanehirae]|uniref:Putative caffeoyl-CoA O-methyltransferase isoform X3 n=1 Tax=Cinnamomum micranthum f. kanehirae TaxID=337451 RepID=A0A443NHW7_9MAGN|nr:putative caffeoyl-CoA O-methyltransferase isoform X3 [Cinnamomum micranthum f. kanehirae]
MSSLLIYSFIQNINRNPYHFNGLEFIRLYILETSVYPREAGPLKEIREVTANHPRSLMATAPDGGQLLAMLLKLIHAKKTIEIGVFTGYSLLLTALVLPKDGKPNSKSPYDFAYVDADKENYMNYHGRLMKLVKVGGLIVYDNTLWSGTVAYSESSLSNTCNFPEMVLSKVEFVKELNKVLAADSRIQMTQLPVGDGVTICMRLY